MPKKPAKSAFGKNAETFVLVNRSRHDPKYYDENESQNVLISANTVQAMPHRGSVISGYQGNGGGMDDESVYSANTKGTGFTTGSRMRSVPSKSIAKSVSGRSRVSAGGKSLGGMSTMSRVSAVSRRIGRITELSEVDVSGLPIDGYDYSQHITQTSGGGVFIPRKGISESDIRTLYEDIGDSASVRSGATAMTAYEEMLEGLQHTRNVGRRLNLPADVLPDVPEDDEEVDAAGQKEVITLLPESMPADLKEILEELDDLNEVVEVERGADEEAEVLAGKVVLDTAGLEELDDDFVLQALGDAPIREWTEGTVTNEDHSNYGAKGFDFDAHMRDLMARAEGQMVDHEDMFGGFGPEEEMEEWSDADFDEDEEGDFVNPEDVDPSHLERLRQLEEQGPAGLVQARRLVNDELLEAMLDEYDDDFIGSLENHPKTKQDGLKPFGMPNSQSNTRNLAGAAASTNLDGDFPLSEEYVVEEEMEEMDDAEIAALEAEMGNVQLGEDGEEARLVEEEAERRGFRIFLQQEAAKKGEKVKSYGLADEETIQQYSYVKPLDSATLLEHALREFEAKRDEGVMIVRQKRGAKTTKSSFQKDPSEQFVRKYREEVEEEYATQNFKDLPPLEDVASSDANGDQIDAKKVEIEENRAAFDEMRQAGIIKVNDDHEPQTDAELPEKPSSDTTAAPKSQYAFSINLNALKPSVMNPAFGDDNGFSTDAASMTASIPISGVDGPYRAPSPVTAASQALLQGAGSISMRKSVRQLHAELHEVPITTNGAGAEAVQSEKFIPFGWAEGDLPDATEEELHKFAKNWRAPKKTAQWDVETVLSTYSNIENHPRSLQDNVSVAAGASVRGPRALVAGGLQDIAEDDEACEAKSVTSHREGSVAASLFSMGAPLRLSKKTGLPMGRSANAGVFVEPLEEEENEVDDDEDIQGMGHDNLSATSSDDEPKNKGTKRNKQETAEEKKARKAAVKEQRRLQRGHKKDMKLAYKDEILRQTHLSKKMDALARGSTII